MDLVGEHRIPAPPATVWRALNDVDVLRDCIPGCEDIAETGPNRFRARITTRIGAIKATFTGRVALSDLDPPKAYTISGQGEGGAAGFVRGSARVTLAADGADATILGYAAKAEVGGKLATIGSRLVQGAAAAAYGDAMAAPQPKHQQYEQTPASPPERHGPTVATTPVIEPVPPEPTVPYTLGQTPRTQNMIIVVGVVLWLCVIAIMLLPA